MSRPVYEFDDSVVFVTGAARGLGRAVALRFAECGADIVLTDVCTDLPANPYSLATDRQLEETARLVERQGVNVLAREMDVRNRTAVETTVDRALDRFGRIDVLVSNAGVWNVEDAVELSADRWDEVVDTNLTGAWNCLKHVGGHMVQAESGGRVVCTTSIGGLVGTAGAAHYAASKHGVTGLVESAAVELAADGVRVNAVSPTGMDTPMIAETIENEGEEPLERVSDACGSMNVIDDELISPADVAEAYLWLASDAAQYVTGVTLPVDAGAVAK